MKTLFIIVFTLSMTYLMIYSIYRDYMDRVESIRTSIDTDSVIETIIKIKESDIDECIRYVKQYNEDKSSFRYKELEELK